MDTQQAIWQQLQEKNLISDQYQAEEKLNAPWFVKLLLAFSGWLASLFIFGFLMITLHDLNDSSIACLIVGCGLIFIAYRLLRDNPPDFLEHLMLAFSLAGQILIAWVLFENELFNSQQLAWIALLIIQSLLCFIMPHYVHRVCSAFFASVAFVISFHFLHLSVFSSAILLFLVILLVLNEWRVIKWQATFEAISYGVILLLIPLNASYALGYPLSYFLHETSQTQFETRYFDEILLIIAMLYLVFTLIQRSTHHFSLKSRIVILTVTVCFCLLSMQASGITIGLALLILGFSNSNKILQGLGISALLYYITSYYYLLDLTLLQKSASLLMIGLFILTLRFALLKLAPPLKQGDNDAI